MQQNIIRSLTTDENTFLNSFPLNEQQKERVIKVWGKCKEPVFPVKQIKKGGISIVFNEYIFLGLILLYTFAHTHIHGLIIGLGWFYTIITVFVIRSTRFFYREFVWLSLSPGILRFYFGRYTWRYYIGHTVKITILCLLWYNNMYLLAVAWFCLSLYGINQSKFIKECTEASLRGQKDFQIENLQPYSFNEKLLLEVRRNFKRKK